MKLPGAAILAGVAALCLAGCGDTEPDEGLFLREIPDFTPPIRPAPDLSQIRPVPDLHADRKAVAMICNVRGAAMPLECGCIANAAADEYSGRALAYLTAQVISDPVEASRVEMWLTPAEREALAGAAARIMEQCVQG